jgi:hypothetical protein
MIKKIIYIFFVLLVLSEPLFGVTKYYIAKNGNDTTGEGTIAKPWLTWAKANTIAAPGDIIVARAGTYAENITVKSGIDVNNKTIYMSYPDERVIVTGVVNAAAKSYARIIGLEITPGTSLGGLFVHGSTYVDIIDNYLHNTDTLAIRDSTSLRSSNLLIRGNIIEHTGCLEGEVDCRGAGAIAIRGTHSIFEYNTIGPSWDAIGTYGGKHIVRNNYFPGTQASDYPGVTDWSLIHIDLWQPQPSSTYIWSSLYENNFGKDNNTSDAHAFQARDTKGAGGFHIVRGNVTHNLGSYMHMIAGTDYNAVYNNTTVDTGSNNSTFFDEGSFYSQYNLSFNNIWMNGGGQTSCTGCSATWSNNTCVDTSSSALCDYTDDPLFTNSATDNFTLQAASPVKGEGLALATVTSANGTGTTFTVSTALPFFDGKWDDVQLVEGDKIRVGTDIVRITDVDRATSTLIVTPSFTWAQNDTITMAYQNADIDQGAYPYRASYNITGSYENVMGTVTVTPNDTNLVRMIVLYEDGIPRDPDYDSPYVFTSVTGAITAVKMYPMLPGTIMYYEASEGSATPTIISAEVNANAAIIVASVDVDITGLANGEFIMTGSISGAINVNSCTEDTGIITCTLASSVIYNETVTLALTDSTAIKNASDTFIEAFTGMAVNNKTPAPIISIDLTGPGLSTTETSVRAGTVGVISIVISGDTFVESDDALKLTILAGLNGSTAFNTCRDTQLAGSLVRSSTTQYDFTPAACASYNITSVDSVTWTIPATAITSGKAAVAGQSITINSDSETGIGGRGIRNAAGVMGSGGAKIGIGGN